MYNSRGYFGCILACDKRDYCNYFLTCPANHTFCLEVTEDFTIGELNILGRVTMNTIAPWWEDTYEMSTRSLMESMAMVQELLQDSSYHLAHSQVIVNLAKKTSTILTSASLASAIYAYTWWDWVYRPCVLASQLVVTITLVQCCYCRHWITSLRKTTSTSFAMAPLVLSQPRGSKQGIIVVENRESKLM
ncbi:unnamed protein product [Oncorhynchus mykiss]|uniref:Uncharacterized protein n=1 Tax=Oncorhynchus mykiss TaxID=8022 RepID=A0A060Z2L3_ONCMY|nr:unnamed protein product [Oncorhynchus mykiss]